MRGYNNACICTCIFQSINPNQQYGAFLNYFLGKLQIYFQNVIHDQSTVLLPEDSLWKTETFIRIALGYGHKIYLFWSVFLNYVTNGLGKIKYTSFICPLVWNCFINAFFSIQKLDSDSWSKYYLKH